MVSGTYICEKHDNIRLWAEAIVKLCTIASQDPEDFLALCDFAEIKDLAQDIVEEAKLAKLDGQRMEDRLIDRSVQGDAMLDLSRGLSALATAMAGGVPASRPKVPPTWALRLPQPRHP